MKLSAVEDWAACKALWQQVFGDDDAYVDNFHDHYYKPERVLTLKDEGGLRSMLVLFPMELRWPDGGLTKASYLYALATDPEVRGQGYATFLMRYTDFVLEGDCVPYLTTVPAEPSLIEFFGRAADFQPCHPIDEAEGECLAPGEVAAERVNGAEYLALREGLLADTAHAVYDEEYLEYQNKVATLLGGGLYRMETAGGPACAVAQLYEGFLDVKELLTPAGCQAEALSALCAALPGEKYRVRCPAGKGELPGAVKKVFGVGKRIPATPKELGESYFGLAFD
jgi:GNAT superfamily N-acetyltransferase